MTKSYHITSRHPNTLVDSLIHTMVWLRDKLHLILMTCDSLTDNLSRLVLRNTIHDDIFDVRIILRQHTLHCTANRLLTVVTTSYDRNFHYCCPLFIVFNFAAISYIFFVKLESNLSLSLGSLRNTMSIRRKAAVNPFRQSSSLHNILHKCSQ